MSSTIAIAVIIVVLVIGSVVAYAIYEWSREHAISRTTRAELTTSDEYRRLSEMAITAAEHTDLKLAEIIMQLSQLREQLDEVQKVLKDVE
jgi:uncharacterized protein (DUF1786 family)